MFFNSNMFGGQSSFQGQYGGAGSNNRKPSPGKQSPFAGDTFGRSSAMPRFGAVTGSTGPERSLNTENNGNTGAVYLPGVEFRGPHSKPETADKLYLLA